MYINTYEYLPFAVSETCRFQPSSAFSAGTCWLCRGSPWKRPCIGSYYIYKPIINLPFGDSAIYFDHGVISWSRWFFLRNLYIPNWVADLSLKNIFGNKAATDGKDLHKYWWNQALAAWFSAESATLTKQTALEPGSKWGCFGIFRWNSVSSRVFGVSVFLCLLFMKVLLQNSISSKCVFLKCFPLHSGNLT